MWAQTQSGRAAGAAMRTAELRDAARARCTTFVRGQLPAPLLSLHARGLWLLSKTSARPALGQGEEELWLVAVFCPLFQFNLKACVLLVVPRRFSRQSQSFNEICTSICQIGFLTHLGHCTLELMLLSFSSGWQLKQREMFICLEVYIDMYLRNGKRSQNRPAFYCLSLCWVFFLLCVLSGEKYKSKDLLWPKSAFSFNLLYFLCVVLFLVSLFSYWLITVTPIFLSLELCIV